MNYFKNKTKLLAVVLVAAAVVSGSAFYLVAKTPAVLLVQTTTPTVGTPTVTPNIIMVSTPTAVTATVQITDPNVITDGVNLLRLDSTGNVTVLGVMHDDGLNGDSLAGDKIYTLQFSVNQAVQGAFAVQASAALKGQVRRVLSPTTQFGIINPSGLALADVAARNSTIVLGTVASQQAKRNLEGNIVTDITLRILQVLKGNAVPQTIFVRILGGSLAGVNSVPLGAPSFTNGETVVLFLNGPGADGFYSVSELALGTYHIRTTPSLGQIAVIDKAYSALDSGQVQSPEFKSFIQASKAEQATLADLYMQLSVKP